MNLEVLTTVPSSARNRAPKSLRVIPSAVHLAAALAAAASIAFVIPSAQAQGVGGNAAVVPRNVVSLSAQAEKDVPQDWLTITLSTTKEGKSAAEVQQALRQDIDSALAEAKAAAKAGPGVQVRTGRFSLYPRYNSSGRMASWQGSAEVVLEGKNFESIGGLAGRITALTVASVEFSLSSEARTKAIADLEGEAIDQFRSRAQAIATRFGFKAFDLREVAVSDSQQGQPVYRPQVASMAAKAMSDAIPVEPGKASVGVTVTGTVEMRP